MAAASDRREILLVGAGHTHALLMLKWAKRPTPAARLTCISNDAWTAYSGMMPGVLAGQYTVEQMQINVARLCHRAGMRLIVDRISRVDIGRRRVEFEHAEPLQFDVMSVGIGSVPDHRGVQFDKRPLSLKPMSTFLSRLEFDLQKLTELPPQRTIRIVIVGGGLGSVETALCLQARMRTALGDRPYSIQLVTAAGHLAAGISARSRALLHDHLNSKGIETMTGRRVCRVGADEIGFAEGAPLPADLVIWATHAHAPAFLEHFELPKNDDGFLLTEQTLRTTSGDPVFAVGDCGSMQNTAMPKAGVFAVRQAPVLWKNIGRTLAGKPLVPFLPQRHFLKLINCGDGSAIGDYRGYGFHGRWVWKLKDRIDRRFVGQFVRAY